MTKEWYEILEEVGWPVGVLVIDFESYFDDEYSLKKMSTIEYILDKRFDLLGMAFQFFNPTDGCIGSFVEKPHLLAWLKKDYNKYTVVCHNAKFDISVLYHHFGNSILNNSAPISTSLLAYFISFSFCCLFSSS